MKTRPQGSKPEWQRNDHRDPDTIGWHRATSSSCRNTDCGAAVCVAPPSTWSHFPLLESRTEGGETSEKQWSTPSVRSEEGCLVDMTYQVAEFTKPLNSVSTLCDAGNVVTFTAQGGIINMLWTGATTQFGCESGMYVLNTRVKSGTLGGMGFCHADVTSRATRAVSPTRKQMFHEVEDEQDQYMLHGMPSLRWAMEGRKLASSTSHTSLPSSLSLPVAVTFRPKVPFLGIYKFKFHSKKEKQQKTKTIENYCKEKN